MDVRKRIVVLIVLVALASHARGGDNETPNAQLEDIRVSDTVMLRGSGEDRIDEEGGTEEIEPEKVFPAESVDYDKDYEETEKVDAKITTPIPETTIDRDFERKFENVSIKDDVEAVVTTQDHTEAALEFTLSMNNHIYKPMEDVYNITDVNNEDISKNDTVLTTTELPTAIDEVEEPMPKISELPEMEDELDPSGQRNPKTHNSDQKPPIDKRNNDGKPVATQQVTKSSTLKGWLEDEWLRPPAAILVPLRPTALSRALAVWNDLVAVEGLNLTDIVIVGFDTHGLSWRSRHNLQGSSASIGNKAVQEALSRLLLKYQGVHTDSETDGTLQALISAAKLVPYDSALFVVTDKGAGDARRLPLALRTLVEKRLKVYTIWTDPNHPSVESELELQQLRNVSKHTEGDVLPYSMQLMEVESPISSADLQQWPAAEYNTPRRAKQFKQIMRDQLDTLLVRRVDGGATSLGVPVENGVLALRLRIEGAVEHAVLYPPNDAPLIDLYNQTSVMAFSPESKTEGYTTKDIFLAFPGADFDTDTLRVLSKTTASDALAPTVGLWHLSVRCDTCHYRLIIQAKTRLHFENEISKDTLKLIVTGPVASVRESILIDEYGDELFKLPFSYQPTAATFETDATDGSDKELVSEMALPPVKGSSVYVKINGRDVRGVPFVRLSGPIRQPEIRHSRSADIVFPDSPNDLELVEELNSRVYNSRLRYNDSNILSYNSLASQLRNQQGNILVAVQIGLSSKIYGSPGDTLQLHFEVTNNRDQSVTFNFGATGELNFLTGINPASQTISARQTVNVIVTARISSSAQPGARDLVTFSVYNSGAEQVSIASYIYVVNTDFNPNDVWAPELTHNFQGSCIGKMGIDCAQNAWSVTIIAKDSVGGLLRLSSSPTGLMYDSNFIAGTREEVAATYRATCCSPRAMITAVDTYGNTNSYIVDITNYLTPAGIAAVVLGVFLAIALIVLIICLIVWCVRRRKSSSELPYTTSSRSRSLG